MSNSQTSPPPGSLPDDSIANTLLAVVGTFAGVALLVVLLRAYIRVFMLKSFKADDWTIISAMICGIGVLVCWVGETRSGIGRHTIYVTPQQSQKINHYQFFHSIIIVTGITLIKLSIAFVLLRFIKTQNFRRFLWCMVAILLAFYIASLGTLIFACVPPQASWDLSAAKTAKCYSYQTFVAIGTYNTVVNIVTDLIFVITPIPVIWSLQINKTSRIYLILILSLGIFVCASSIVKLYYQVTYMQDPDPLRHNYYSLWNAVEIYTGIIAACLPSLRPIFNTVLKLSSASRSKSGARSRYAQFPSGTGLSLDRLKSQRRPAPGQDGYGIELLHSKNNAEGADPKRMADPRVMIMDKGKGPFDGYCAEGTMTGDLDEIELSQPVISRRDSREDDIEPAWPKGGIMKRTTIEVV